MNTRFFRLDVAPHRNSGAACHSTIPSACRGDVSRRSVNEDLNPAPAGRTRVISNRLAVRSLKGERGDFAICLPRRRRQAKTGPLSSEVWLPADLSRRSSKSEVGRLKGGGGSSVVCLPSSVFCHPSSVIRLLSSVIRHLSIHMPEHESRPWCRCHLWCMRH